MPEENKPQVPASATGYVLPTNGANGNGASNGASLQGSVVGPGAGSAVGLPPPNTPSLSTLLGPKPVFSARMFEEQEEGRKKIAKTLFWVSLVLLLGTYGFFTSQLNKEFTWLDSQLGPNVANRFETSNAEIRARQTELNLVRFRKARLLLDDANTQIDPFQRQTGIFNSTFSTASQIQNAAVELQILGASIKRSLGEVQKVLSQPLGVDTITPEPTTEAQRETQYESLLVERLNREKSAITGDNQANLVEARLMDNVLRLVQNRQFRDMLKGVDLENVKEDEFSALLTKIREEGTDELSSIDKIRRGRLDWGKVISDIHDVTRKADPLYGQGLFKTVGGFLYTSYQFDAKSGRVSISGLTKTSDSKTFSTIASLVDAIEKSPKFKDIDFRSFSKSRDEGGDFSSSLSLEFTLQPAGEQDPRDDVVISSN